MRGMSRISVLGGPASSENNLILVPITHDVCCDMIALPEETITPRDSGSLLKMPRQIGLLAFGSYQEIRGQAMTFFQLNAQSCRDS